jgi:hypothetical protein
LGVFLGFFVGLGVGLAVAVGAGVGVAAGPSAAVSTALWSPVLEIHQAVAGASSSAPGSTTMSRRSRQPWSPSASWYCAMYFPLALSKATLRWLERSKS